MSTDQGAVSASIPSPPLPFSTKCLGPLGPNILIKLNGQYDLNNIKFDRVIVIQRLYQIFIYRLGWDCGHTIAAFMAVPIPFPLMFMMRSES